jgi:DNA-binding MarR family transcriptional regulator
VVEVDDAAEERLPKGLWTVSVVMWRNCMQWLPASEAEMVAAARTPTDVNGMRRWGYVEGDEVLRPTRRGARAIEAWDGVPDEVEQRWEVPRLRAALVGLAEELDGGLPDTMPIVRHGWATRREKEPERVPGPVAIADLGLDSLFARPLTAFALEYESSGKLSLALSANLLPVLGPEPIPLRDLPDATGIQREQLDNAAGYLERAGLAEIVPTPGAKRGKSVALTRCGEEAKAASAKKLARLEATWEERHGVTFAAVRDTLASMTITEPEHPPGTWRSKAKSLARLPRFPLVTHRGGFPDGA